ncbi:hypothetical protein K4749_08635 [Streptomyces sp. TRM72054]|uniref:hypothetical protein n=1 Tax=Streptomyces sp. TRM72054 TaxID=2870562 RepID=UPI001C8CA8D1|nr:hypothetical protein [Streptomyces sp. TRM72054]MBX9393655.1 hypothetical protein [Streptomyces sp. TRM72054]
MVRRSRPLAAAALVVLMTTGCYQGMESPAWGIGDRGDVASMTPLPGTRSTAPLVMNPGADGDRPAGVVPAGLRGSPAKAAGGFHDIGSLAGTGTQSEATDLNDRGDIVGATAVPGSRATHAFLMNPRVHGGRLTDITPSEPRSSRAEGVNRSGTVVGTLGAPGSGQRLEPFVWRARTGLDVLPLPPGADGAQAVDINDKGTVLVVGTNAAGVGLPVGSFLWDPASRTYTALPTLDPSADGPVSLARTLDERGGVAGGVVTEVGEQRWHHTAVVWEPGTLTPRQLSGGPDSFATDRNENGLIVGWQISAPGGASTAVYWPSADADPVALPGRVAYEVNDRGQIVGIRDFPTSSAFPFTAVMWEPGRGRTTDLGDKNLGSYVLAVNSSGRSAGFAVAAGEGRTYNTAGWWDKPRRAG